MAQKIITDLQLIAAFVDSLSVPVDNGIATYRTTSQQIKAYILANQNILLAMLDEDIFTGLTAVTPAGDDYFPIIDTSDSNKTKKGLVSNFERKGYRTVSSYPDTILSTDRTLVLTSTAGTVTFPANDSGSPGRQIRLIHGGANFVAYTFATTGGAVFKTAAGDVASGSYAHYTLGEMSQWEDDGTNWRCIGRNTISPTTSWVPTLTGFGTASAVSAWWNRYGDRCKCRVDFTNGTTTAVLGKISLPGGHSFSTVKSSGKLMKVGEFFQDINTTGVTIPATTRGPWAMVADPADATVLFFGDAVDMDSGGPYFQVKNGNSLGASGQGCMIEFDVPILNWQP